MGKPERKARERIYSSSSYFLRCFGISRKIHSDKPIVDATQETQKKKKKKKKTRTRWFSRPAKFRFNNGEITPPAPSQEAEKQKLIVEDDKQNLFRVKSHVTDRQNITASGYNKAVDHESNEKDANEERDINPDPLSFLGYDDTCHEPVSTGGKLDQTKTVGSGPKPKELKEKSSRVRKGSRVGNFDPVIGISIIMLTLMIMLMWGRLCAILCTSTWCYVLPRLKEAATAAAMSKRKRGSGGKGEGGLLPGDFDLNYEAFKKKVVLDGFLDRQRRVSL